MKPASHKPHAQPLVAAAQALDLNAMQTLVAQGANVNVAWRGNAPLHALVQPSSHAVTEETPQRLACVDWLLRQGADVEQPGGWPPTRALVLAGLSGAPQIAQRLQQAGAVLDDHAAAALADTRRVKRGAAKLAQARDAHGFHALHYAAGSRLGINAAAACVLALLEAGADANAEAVAAKHRLSPIYFAGNAHNAQAFELLLKHGASAEAALVVALWNSSGFELADMAMAHGAQPDQAMADDRPLLNSLVQWGRVKQALYLLQRGASPLVADAHGVTALAQARSRGNQRLLEALQQAAAKR